MSSTPDSSSFPNSLAASQASALSAKQSFSVNTSPCARQQCPACNGLYPVRKGSFLRHLKTCLGSVGLDVNEYSCSCGVQLPTRQHAIRHLSQQQEQQKSGKKFRSLLLNNNTRTQHKVINRLIEKKMTTTQHNKYVKKIAEQLFSNPSATLSAINLQPSMFLVFPHNTSHLPPISTVMNQTSQSIPFSTPDDTAIELLQSLTKSGGKQ